jgi:hypothetical protein
MGYASILNDQRLAGRVQIGHLLDNEGVDRGRWVSEKEESVQDGTQDDEKETEKCRTNRKDYESAVFADSKLTWHFSIIEIRD